MCGIAGIINLSQKVTKEQLTAAIQVLHHRGPDGSGYFVNETETVGLAHTRLALIDLSEKGHQPMTDAKRKYTITYNGEVYNFQELRQELQQSGYQFYSESDTEVILYGYQQWGDKLPERLEGMFAFAILDEAKQEIFLARDPFGIKPLYYYTGPTSFAFASEIKGILEMKVSPKQIREESISEFLANRYIPTPHTIWQNIFKLQAGCWLKINVNTLQQLSQKYWEISSSTRLLESDADHKVNELMIKSLKDHLISDVNIGSFLSGGFDSTLLVYMMQKKLYYQTEAFAIGFDDWDQSEHKYAEMVAQSTGAKLHIRIQKNIDLGLVKKLMWHYDDPIADISIIPTYEVSELACKFVKAVVSGEGADECHAGYWWDKPDKFIFKNKFGALKSSIIPPSFKEIKYHYIQAMSMGLFDNHELKKALVGKFRELIPNDPFSHFDNYKLKHADTIHQIQYLDIYTFMSELILTKVDRASMANSLEIRVPFLNKSLVQYMFNLDSSVYTKPQIQKPIISNILRGNVPDQILDRPKQGFVGPDTFYMNYSLYQSTLMNGRLINENVIDSNYVKHLLQQKDHWRLWKLFVLENWWQVWMD